MSRRSQIAMSTEEIDAYLHESHLCRIGTIGPKGDIHLVTMNYGFVDGNVAFWTYKAAQKTKNLERNPTLCAVRCASNHSSVEILSGQRTALTSSSRISAAVPGRVASPASRRRVR